MKRKLALLVLPTLLAVTACGSSGKGLKRIDSYIGSNSDNATHHDYAIYTRNGDGSINHINYYQVKTNDAKSFYFARTIEYATDTNLKQDYTETSFKEDQTVEQIHHILLEKDTHGNDTRTLRERIDPKTSARTSTENIVYVHTYNSDENLAQTIKTDTIGQTFRFQYSYDNLKRLTGYECYLKKVTDISESNYEKYDYQYKGNTDLIEERKLYGVAADGSWELKTTNTLTYNNNNLLTKEVGRDEKDNIIKWENTITIEDKKSKSVQKVYNDQAKILVIDRVEEKEYAEEYKSNNQKPIKMINTLYVGGDENEQSTYTYSYNSDNNILEDSFQKDKYNSSTKSWDNNTYIKRIYQY